MNRILLALVMLPSVFWKNMGADIIQLKAILDAKLKMDDRKPINLGRRQEQQKKPRKAMSLVSMILFFVIGFLYLFPLFTFQNNMILGLWASLTMFLFMLTFSLVTDFSNVLVDTRDKVILFSRPINDKTLFLSRMLHIFIYLFRIVLPMSLPAWLYLGYAHGWKAAVVYPFVMLLMVFMALFLVNACYLLLLKMVKPERFKEVINYLQIAFSIVLFGCYYLLPRVYENALLQQVDVNDYPWIKWFPTYWFASVFSSVGAIDMSAGNTWLSLLAVIVPIACLYISIKWLSPNFIAMLSGIDTESGPARVVKAGKSAFSKKMANLLNRSSEAKAGFSLAWLQTARSRSFKMRVYPSFATVPIYFVFMFFINKKDSVESIWEQLPETSLHLLLLYMASFVMMQALGYLIYSDQYKAAWVYYVSPVRYPGKIMGGAYKAMWVKFFLPLFIAISVFILFVWGPGAIPDIILALMNVMIFTLLVMRFSYRQLPFSQLEQMNNKAGKALLRMVFSLFTIGLLAGGHYLAVHFLWLKIIFLLLSAALLWMFWESYTKTTWDNLDGIEDVA